MPYIGNQPYQGVIDSGNILNGSIDTVDLKDGSVTSAKLETIGGLTAGSYTTANITVDSKGRVTLASSGSGGVSSITGTADQITASASTGAITLSLPQSINTTSSPSFANITLTGEIRGPSTLIIDPATVGDDTGIVRIRGDLQVDGTTTTINSTTLEVADLNITLAKNAANAAAATGAGITVAGANATLTYASASDCWSFNKNIIVPVDGTIFGYSNTGARSYIQLYSSAAADMSIGTTYNSASIKFLTGATQNGTLRMRISGDGDVSINTTDARTRLFVASSNASDTITLGSVSGGFALSNLNTAYGTQFGSFSTGNGWIQVARMDGTPTAYNLCLQPSGGNVGIGGITNPVLTLHTVKDNSSAYDPSIVAFNTISAIANRTSGALTNALAGFFTEVNGEWYIGGVTNSANTNSDFVFVGRNGGTRAERLRITSAGDVAIGDTTASGYKLKVAGTANVTGALVVNSYAAVGSIVANDPGSGYYSYNNRIGGGLAVTGTLYNAGNLFANRFVLNQGSAGVTRTSGTVAAGWYRFARSADGGVNSYGTRGGCTFYMYTTGGWSGPGQTVIDLFKDYSTNGNLTVDTKGNYYFSNWRIAMDNNYAYLEGWTNGFSFGGDNTFNTIIDSYGWDIGGWTLYSEPLTAGLTSPSYIIRASYINLNGRTLQRNISTYGSEPDDFVTVNGLSWGSAFDNPTVDLFTFPTPGVIYANLICEVEVYQTPWSNSGTGNIHTGYANYGNQGNIKNVSTMTVKANMPSAAHTNIGTLSWSGNTLRYTSNRASNYDHYSLRYTVRHQEIHNIQYFI